MKNLVIGYGNIGKLIAAELKNAGEHVSVGRHTAGESDGYSAVSVDLLDIESVRQAVDGHDVVYVTTGLSYSLKTWRTQWPSIIDSIIAATTEAKAKLVFIDNIYLYGPSPLQNPITEEHPRTPISEKGKVRLELVDKLEMAMKNGLDVLIVRCADFYGPSVTTSSVTMAIEAAQKGKKAYCMGNSNTRHTYSYVPDIARATVLLARSDDTFNQTWHVPSAPAITGTELMRLVESQLGAKVKWSTLQSSNMFIPSLFVPILRELKEMMYQFENDYVFDSSKFQKRFPDFAITSYTDGIAATVVAARAGD